MASLNPAPPPQDARPLTSSSVQQKKKFVVKNGGQIRINHSPSDTLEARCRSVVAAHLERYPPEAFGLLSPIEWDSVVRERNEKTTPSTGTGGLDGTGRLLPAISDRFLTQVEATHPHFADSSETDRLVWADCVEYRFHSGGLTRPPALQYPWPILVNKIKRSGDALVGFLKSDKSSHCDVTSLARHVRMLSESPMNVSLLQATGVGKSVKKFLKTCAKEKGASLDANTVAKLERTLQRWKDMAAHSGVQLNSSEVEAMEEDDLVQQDLRLAESCQSWRELFLVLKEREAKRRADQGRRMRERRNSLATGRAKVIKVRPAKMRHDNILERAEKKKGTASFGSSTTTPAFSSGNAKMKALKKESRIATTLQKSSARPAAKKKDSFGAAVAFATNTKPTGQSKRGAGELVALGGGKRMKIPAKATRKPPFHSR